jgi:hypothetical protein
MHKQKTKQPKLEERETAEATEHVFFSLNHILDEFGLLQA